MLIAFDIDGTLADITHRLKYIKALEQPFHSGPLYEPFKPNWDKFFNACVDDTPIPEMVNLFKSLNFGNRIVFVTGRSNVVKPETIKWLETNLSIKINNISTSIYMRRHGDHQPDYKLKQSLINDIVKDHGQRPDIAFDDRQQVVDMWRAEGIRCCQVDKGDF